MDIRTRLPAISSLFTCLSKGSRRPHPASTLGRALPEGRGPYHERPLAQELQPQSVPASKTPNPGSAYYSIIQQKAKNWNSAAMLYNRHPVTFHTLSRSFLLFCNGLFRHPYRETEKDFAVRNYNAHPAKILKMKNLSWGCQSI